MKHSQQAWRALAEHQTATSNISLNQLFAEHPKRFEEFSLQSGGFLLDYSKQRITQETLDKLFSLAEEVDLKHKIESMFSGEKLNVTENRPVLHTALRDFSENPLLIDGEEIKHQIHDVLFQMEDFVDRLHTHQYLSSSAKPFTDILCLGIGGSALGPVLVCEALEQYKITSLNLHFISNCFGPHLSSLLNTLSPETTLCIISSKTFTTPETIENAQSVFAWMLEKFKAPDKVSRHFLGITADPARAQKFGILPENIFEFWDWVGGRYSIWSAVGLPVALMIGMAQFRSFLRGARTMDTHFYTAPLAKNMPVLMGLLGIWNTNFLNTSSLAIIPYDDRLRTLPAYLQQLEMESNGKQVDSLGQSLSYTTAPVIWGGVGCDSQHAFMQLLHQGTQTIPVDFLVPAKATPGYETQHQLLFASCLSQSKALMEGISLVEHDRISNAKACPGNRPSSTLVYPDLSPQTLGALLALYEHKVFVQGMLWGINSFDQFGVELGKTLAKKLIPLLKAPLNEPVNEPGQDMDSSSKGLIRFYQSLNPQSQETW